MSATVRLAATLTEVLDERYPRRRREFAEAIGVSESALSQYTRGDATPRLHLLVRMAETLGVPLDYLVTGAEPRTTGPDSDQSDAAEPHVGSRELLDRVEDLTKVTGRIGEGLMARIGEEARKAVEQLHTGPGVLTREDMELLARHSSVIRVVTADDLIDKDQGDAARNRDKHSFFDTIVWNLRHTDACYHYMLPVEYSEQAEEFVEELQEALNPDAGRRLHGERITFVYVPRYLTTQGHTVHQLDDAGLAGLEHHDRLLYLRVKPFLSPLRGEPGQQLLSVRQPPRTTGSRLFLMQPNSHARADLDFYSKVSNWARAGLFEHLELRTPAELVAAFGGAVTRAPRPASA